MVTGGKPYYLRVYTTLVPKQPENNSEEKKG
jgi:hypothetical protein